MFREVRELLFSLPKIRSFCFYTINMYNNAHQIFVMLLWSCYFNSKKSRECCKKILLHTLDWKILRRTIEVLIRLDFFAYLSKNSWKSLDDQPTSSFVISSYMSTNFGNPISDFSWRKCSKNHFKYRPRWLCCQQLKAEYFVLIWSSRARRF